MKSVAFCNEIIVVDDFSTDKTIVLVHKVLKYKLFQRKLNGDFAGQRNFGMSKANFDWILFVDADEQISPELRKEIVNLKESDNDAYFLRRRDFFWNKELMYGEIRQIRQIGLIRLIRKNSGKWLGNVHEVFHTAKNVGHLKSFINHYPHPTLKEFIVKVNVYSSLRAEELYNHGKTSGVLEIVFFPFFKFIYNYVLNLGFLDGAAGFAYAFLMSFHSFLVRAKLYQLQQK